MSHEGWQELFGELSMGAEYGAMMSIFSLMEIAEDEIAAAKARWPEAAEAVDDLFAVACAPAIPASAPESVFRTHVRQLCRAAATGADLDVPTLVEWACIIGLGSLDLAVAPSTGICAPFQGDAETMAAFGQQALPFPEHLGEEWAERMRLAHRKMYAEWHWTKRPRSEAYVRCRSERRARQASAKLARQMALGLG